MSKVECFLLDCIIIIFVISNLIIGSDGHLILFTISSFLIFIVLPGWILYKCWEYDTYYNYNHYIKCSWNGHEFLMTVKGLEFTSASIGVGL